MSIARTFKKTVFASAITAILPHVAFAATITVSPSSPDQISLPDATGVVDEILFETNGQTVEKHLGANKDIDKLTVTNGLTLDDQSGTSGKIIFHMSAKEINLGATNYGSAWDNPSSCDNEPPKYRPFARENCGSLLSAYIETLLNFAEIAL